MEIKEQLMADLKEAMKNKNVLEKNTIQGARAEILKWEKDNAAVADNARVESLIAASVKQKNKALQDFAMQEAFCEQTRKEIKVLEKYLPKQLSDEEVCQELDYIIRQLGATSMKDMGAVMKEAKAKFGNTVDGKRLSDFVKQGLSRL